MNPYSKHFCLMLNHNGTPIKSVYKLMGALIYVSYAVNKQNII